MRILFATSEAHPLVKTGGLADVSGALPAALQALGTDVRILLPGYSAVLEKMPALQQVAQISDLPPVGSVTLLAGVMPDTAVPVLVIDCPGLYQRPGNIYLDANNREWADNALRFGILSRIAALLAGSNSPLPNWIPNIVHCNDWQTGLAPAFMHYQPETRAKSIICLHNLAFQGCFPADWVERLGLPSESYQINGVEYYHQLSFLKAGIYYANAITTVSPTYAQEIQTSTFGFGMEGLLSTRKRDILGILNGIETRQWDPANDPYLIKNYDSSRLHAKKAVKQELQRKLQLAPAPAAPLLGAVSRLTYQKGLDLLLSIAPDVLADGCQIALLGSGEASLESDYRRLMRQYPGQVSVSIGYDEPLAHQIMAGADIFIMPSRFEPCGLNQMYGLRYGTPPIVTSTGGLADSVTDTNAASLTQHQATGFVIPTASTTELQHGIRRALACYHNKKVWCSIQKNGMLRDLGWAASARAYMDLYQRLLG